MAWLATKNANIVSVDTYYQTTESIRRYLQDNGYIMPVNETWQECHYQFTAKGIEYCQAHNIPLATQADLNAKREAELIEERRQLQARIIEIGDELAKLHNVPF